MDYHLDSALISHRTYFTQEENKVLTEFLRIYSVIPREGFTELVESKAFLAARQTGYHIPRNELYLGCVHLLEAGLCPCLLLIGILGFGALPLQDMQVECKECIALETQASRPVFHTVCQVCPRPVEYRHEIVCDAFDTAFCKIADGLLVIRDVFHEIPGLGLDMLMHRNAFHHTPDKSVSGNHFLPPAYLIHCPHLSVRDMMQRMHNICNARLLDIIQADRVIRAVPPPALLHQIHRYYFKLFIQLHP